MANWRNRIVGQGEESPKDLIQAANANNARLHPDSQRDALEKVIDEVGLVSRVLKNKRTGRLIDGHLRVELALARGEKSLPVEYVDLSPDEEKLVLATYDPITGLAEFDADILKGLEIDIKEAFDFDLSDFFAEDMLDEIIGNGNGTIEQEPPEPQIDRAAELRQEWGTELGQVWQLGEHRVVCGDCTDRAIVKKAMRDDLCRMIFTDPPYGIGKDIANDNLKGSDKIDFYRQWTDVGLSFCIENAYVYVWGYFDTLSDYWQEVIKPRQDCNFRNFIVWEKNFVQGRNAEDFRQFPENYEAALLFIFGQPFQNGPWSTSPNAEYYPEMFEPIRVYLDTERQKMGWDIPTVKKMVGHSDLSGDHWFNKSQWSMPTQEVYEILQEQAKGFAFRTQYDELRGYFDNKNGFTDLWRFDKLTTTSMHPTVKPVEVCQRGVISTSGIGDIVLDLFLGSGSTLLACEESERLCRGAEINPSYVAVTLQRFKETTGITPELVTS